MQKSELEESLWSKSFILLLISSFLLFFAFYLLLPILPMFLQEEMFANKASVAFALFMYSVTALIIRPFAGYMTDNLSRRKLLLSSYAAFVFIFILYVFVQSLSGFVWVRALHGLFFGLLTIANSTVAIDLMPANKRGEGVGYYGAVMSLSMAIGPMVSLQINEMFHNYDMLFTLSFATGLVGLAILLFVKIKHNDVEETVKEPLSLDRFYLLKGTPVALSLLSIAFAYGLIVTYVAIYGISEVGLQSGASLFFVLFALGIMVSRFRVGRLLDKGYISTVIVVGQILALIGLVCIVVFKSMYGFYASAIVLGVSFGVMGPSFQFLFLNLARHNQRGTANSSFFIMWDLGIGIGVLFGGNVAGLSSYADSYLMSALVVFLGLVWFKWYVTPYFEKHKLR
ncbi:MAG: MFS transporter [Paludibacteraceae bacterium]|nr:MFS transporter [Paludibacteraceae bacterium]MBP6285037.1 MFS transporter [Paludibacteraceae bacterium]